MTDTKAALDAFENLKSYLKETRELERGCAVLKWIDAIQEALTTTPPAQPVTDDEVREAVDRLGYYLSTQLVKDDINYKDWSIIIRAATKSEWQDISSAPRDGTFVYCFQSGTDLPVVCSFDKISKCWDIRGQEDLEFMPTHWKPLDAPKKGGW